MYAQGAGLAYETARRAEQQHTLADAGRRLSKSGTLQKTAAELVALAKDAFGADFVTFWPYYGELSRFAKEGSARAGFDGDLPEPRPGKSTDEALEEEYVWGVITDREEQELEPEYRMKERFGIVSFHAVALMARGEPVGVLYVSYKSTRRFSALDEQFLRELANIGGSAIKGAMLSGRLFTAEKAASIVSEFRETSELTATLHSIASRARDAAQCDSVTVFAYDSERRQFFLAELRDRLTALRRHMDGDGAEPAGAGSGSGSSRGHGRPRRRRQGP